MKQRALPPWPEGNHSAPIIVIEKRALIRESLARRLGEEFGCPVVSFPDIDSWQKASSGSGAQFILVSARESDHEALHALGASEIGANVMVLPDTTHLDDIVRSLKRGAFAGLTNKGLRL
jgi:DNA-binding NtrC family response regulator